MPVFRTRHRPPPVQYALPTYEDVCNDVCRDVLTLYWTRDMVPMIRHQRHVRRWYEFKPDGRAHKYPAVVWTVG